MARRFSKTAAISLALLFATTTETALAQRATTACTAGVKTVGGATERTFCGPAKATIKVGSKSFTIVQGTCTATSAYLSVNIGTVVPGRTTKNKPNYFGLDVGRVPGTNSPPAGSDGTYTKGVILSAVYGGQSFAVDSDMSSTKALLSGGRKRGTVTGTTLTGQKLTASFHC